MIVVDTSIAIAALSPRHDRSAEAADRCREPEAEPSCRPPILRRRFLARASVMGGRHYDGLVALTAQAHERTLISLDLTAERTYRLLGIQYRLLT